MTNSKRTSLYETYKDQAKIVSFHGWDMPVQFLGIMKEHEAVRTKAGLFDVSHMGELEISGVGALDLIQKTTTNDASTLKIGDAQYTVMCYPNGGTVDDLLVYRLDEDKYLLVLNASNIEKDEAWIRKHQEKDVFVENCSDQIGLIALQGPLAENILQRLVKVDLSTLKPFQFKQNVEINGASVLVSRTGYTGEDGFELYFQKDNASSLWNALLETGKKDGLLPCGLGARDTLRFEARFCLYGQELTEDISPIEASVGFAVKENKGEFIGSDVILKQKIEGAPRKLVGLQMVDRGIPRSHYPVYKNGELIGEITTGTHSPTLKKSMGLALIKREEAIIGDIVEVEIRGKKLKAEIVKTPFYKRPKFKAKSESI